jgi:hypothetical protein
MVCALRYQVRYNSGSYSTTLQQQPFTYSAASAGVYDFQIKDSKGCTTVVEHNKCHCFTYIYLFSSQM